jgi:ribonucleotide monophosphatase NagD (HAD superfamily)
MFVCRCDTDILFGHNSGLTTLLVLTGVTTMSEVEQFAGQGKATLVPDFYVPTLSHLLAETLTQNE